VQDDRRILAREIAAFETTRQELERKHWGKWVLFKDADLVGVYETLGATADDAVCRFGRGPYLIRQVGAQALTYLPRLV
jgi:hypothetical protein